METEKVANTPILVVSIEHECIEPPATPVNTTNDVNCTFTENGRGHACVQEARQLLAKAEADVSQGLSKCLDWMAARDNFNEAGALFSAAGLPEEAARAFLHACIITQAFDNKEETKTALGFAVENLQLVEPLLAVSVLKRLSDLLKEGGFVYQAARCNHNAAILLEGQLGDPKQAIEMYRNAISLYGNKGFSRSFSRSCMERISSLTVEMEDYTEASKLFIEETQYAPLGRPSIRQFFMSLLCMLAEGRDGDDRYFDSLYYTRKRFEVLQEEEKHFQHGKEKKLIQQIIEANDNGSLNDFDVAVYAYKSSSTYTPDPVFEQLIKRCRANLYEHMEQYI